MLNYLFSCGESNFIFIKYLFLYIVGSKFTVKLKKFKHWNPMLAQILSNIHQSICIFLFPNDTTFILVQDYKIIRCQVRPRFISFFFQKFIGYLTTYLLSASSISLSRASGFLTGFILNLWFDLGTADIVYILDMLK